MDCGCCAKSTPPADPEKASPGISGSTANSLAQTSTIAYGPGAGDAAQMLADRLQLTATASDSVAPDTVRLTLGADFPAAQYMTDRTPTTTSTPVTTVDATASGTQAPAPTDLTEMAGAKTRA